MSEGKVYVEKEITKIKTCEGNLKVPKKDEDKDNEEAGKENCM